MVFTINGDVWNVYFVPSSHPILVREDGVLAPGCCDNLTHSIYISNKIYGNFYKKVLCHEIVHAAMYSYKIFLTLEEEELLAELISTFGQEIIDITNVLFNQIKGRYIA